MCTLLSCGYDICIDQKSRIITTMKVIQLYMSPRMEFRTARDTDFIFCMHNLLMKPFQATPRLMTLKLLF